MKVTKCDICKVEAPKDYRFDRLVLRPGMLNAAETELDLCPRCFKELRKWLKVSATTFETLRGEPAESLSEDELPHVCTDNCDHGY